MSEVPAPVSDGICEQLTWVYTLRMTPGYDAT